MQMIKRLIQFPKNYSSSLSDGLRRLGLICLAVISQFMDPESSTIDISKLNELVLGANCKLTDMKRVFDDIYVRSLSEGLYRRSTIVPSQQPRQEEFQSSLHIAVLECISVGIISYLSFNEATQHDTALSVFISSWQSILFSLVGKLLKHIQGSSSSKPNPSESNHHFSCNSQVEIFSKNTQITYERESVFTYDVATNQPHEIVALHNDYVVFVSNQVLILAMKIWHSLQNDLSPSSASSIIIRETFLESLWWFYHRVSGFMYELTLSAAIMASFSRNIALIELLHLQQIVFIDEDNAVYKDGSSLSISSALMLMTIDHFSVVNTMGKDTLQQSIVVMAIMRCLNALIECVALPTLLNILLQIILFESGPNIDIIDSPSLHYRSMRLFATNIFTAAMIKISQYDAPTTNDLRLFSQDLVSNIVNGVRNLVLAPIAPIIRDRYDEIEIFFQQRSDGTNMYDAWNGHLSTFTKLWSSENYVTTQSTPLGLSCFMKEMPENENKLLESFNRILSDDNPQEISASRVCLPLAGYLHGIAIIEMMIRHVELIEDSVILLTILTFHIAQSFQNNVIYSDSVTYDEDLNGNQTLSHGQMQCDAKNVCERLIGLFSSETLLWYCNSNQNAGKYVSQAFVTFLSVLSTAFLRNHISDTNCDGNSANNMADMTNFEIIRAIAPSFEQLLSFVADSPRKNACKEIFTSYRTIIDACLKDLQLSTASRIDKSKYKSLNHSVDRLLKRFRHNEWSATTSNTIDVSIASFGGIFYTIDNQSVPIKDAAFDRQSQMDQVETRVFDKVDAVIDITPTQEIMATNSKKRKYEGDVEAVDAVNQHVVASRAIDRIAIEIDQRDLVSGDKRNYSSQKQLRRVSTSFVRTMTNLDCLRFSDHCLQEALRSLNQRFQLPHEDNAADISNNDWLAKQQNEEAVILSALQTTQAISSKLLAVYTSMRRNKLVDSNGDS